MLSGECRGGKPKTREAHGDEGSPSHHEVSGRSGDMGR